MHPSKVYWKFLNACANSKPIQTYKEEFLMYTSFERAFVFYVDL